MVKNGEFAYLALTLPTGDDVEIFPGGSEDPGRDLLGRRPSEGAVSRQFGARASTEAMSGGSILTEFTEPDQSPRAHEDVPAGEPAPALPPSRVVRVAVGRGEWMLTLPPAKGAAAHHLRQAASILAGRIRGESGATGQWIQRVPDKTIDARLGPAVLYGTMNRALLYCPEGQMAESAALSLSALSAYFEYRHGGVALVVNRVPCAELPLALHPAAIVAQAGSAALRAQVCICASLVSRPVAAAIERLGTAWLAYSGAADVVAASRPAGSCRRRRMHDLVSACDPPRLSRGAGWARRPGYLT